jgi:hypothetical protein
MSGFYNYHPTIARPQEFLVQTASQQPPFYFGGSQVPVNLNPSQVAKEGMEGNGLTTKNKYSKIYIPSYKKLRK